MAVAYSVVLSSSRTDVHTRPAPIGGIARVIAFRTEDERRSVDEISLAEFLGLIQQQPEALSDPDPATTLARHLGISRVASSTRYRREGAIETAEVWRSDGRPHRQSFRRFMIYCRGMAEEAMFAMGQIMDRLRLTVNEQKARM